MILFGGLSSETREALRKIIYLDIIRRNFLISGISDGLPDIKLDPVNLAKID